jgi:hypothetical protein
MDPLPVIEHLDSGTDRDVRVRSGVQSRPVNQFFLQETVPGFPQGVIIALPLPTPARGHAVLLQTFRIGRRSLWAPPIRVRPHGGR